MMILSVFILSVFIRLVSLVDCVGVSGSGGGESSPLVLLSGEQQSILQGDEGGGGGVDLLLLHGSGLWANSRRSATGPRARDLQPSALQAALGSDFDPKWMSTAPLQPHTEETKGGGGPLPPGLNEEARKVLLTLSTCKVEFVWRDLGPDFWPRWLRSGQCQSNSTCSYPPGMTCLPGPPKHLTVLRWHCRLRKNSKRKKIENNVWGSDGRKGGGTEKRGSGGGGRRRRRRSKYRCQWIKVPYPVGEKCLCSCR